MTNFLHKECPDLFICVHCYQCAKKQGWLPKPQVICSCEKRRVFYSNPHNFIGRKLYLVRHPETPKLNHVLSDANEVILICMIQGFTLASYVKPLHKKSKRHSLLCYLNHHSLSSFFKCFPDSGGLDLLFPVHKISILSSNMWSREHVPKHTEML